MQREIMYGTRREHRPAPRGKVFLGIAGGVLYLVVALAIMQVAFYVWAGMW
jgi:hypothetical protein